MNIENNDAFLRRLERSFDIQEKEYQKTRDDVSGLKTQQSFIQRDLATLAGSIENVSQRVSAAIDALSSKMDDRSKINWPAFAVAVPLFVAVISLAGVLLTTYTSSAIAPIVNTSSINSENVRHIVDTLHTVETASIASQAAEATSRTDREQLNGRLRVLEGELSGEIGTRRATTATVKVSLAEIESQFHALSNLENLRAAQQERLNSMLYEAANPGKRYPNGTFFPTSMFQNGIGGGEEKSGSTGG